jgi:hypothetical protein
MKTPPEKSGGFFYAYFKKYCPKSIDIWDERGYNIDKKRKPEVLKMKMLENIKSMSVEELESLIQKASEILAEKKRENAGEFEFEFSATNDPRKGKPYVARLYWGGEKVERDFFDLNQQWGKKEVTVSGKYTARAGDIVEKRVGGSWKNDYRYWYFVTETGEEVKVADIDDSEAKVRVTQYLRNEISAKELLEKAS